MPFLQTVKVNPWWPELLSGLTARVGRRFYAKSDEFGGSHPQWRKWAQAPLMACCSISHLAVDPHWHLMKRFHQGCLIPHGDGGSQTRRPRRHGIHHLFHFLGCHRSGNPQPESGEKMALVWDLERIESMVRYNTQCCSGMILRSLHVGVAEPPEP